jgi:hypothetical protein
MSEDVYRIVKDTIKAKLYREMRVKGRRQPVVTYELLS